MVEIFGACMMIYKQLLTRRQSLFEKNVLSTEMIDNNARSSLIENDELFPINFKSNLPTNPCNKMNIILLNNQLYNVLNEYQP